MRYTVEFNTKISLRVVLEADDEDAAADEGWALVNDYLSTVYGDPQSQITADASLDGVGADRVEAQT